MNHTPLHALCVSLLAGAVLAPSISGELVPVRYREGTTHGFLVLRDLAGKTLAAGDLTQIIRGNEVISRLAFHFKDGSLDEDTTVFTQRSALRLVSDHHVQKGPSFPQPLDVTINVPKGRVITRYEEKGAAKVDDQHMALPPELANGMIMYVMKNMRNRSNQIKLPYLASMPKPKLIKVNITAQDDEKFEVASFGHQARHIVMKLELGGVSGIVAPLIGKQPDPYDFWMLDAEAPTFIKMEGQFYNGGPVWTIELSAPIWPKALPANASAREHQ